MFKQLRSIIQQLNPWLRNSSKIIINQSQYRPRKITDILLKPDWDKLCLVLVGPRQSGKTTLGKLISQYLINTGRFQTLLYLSCDFLEIRQALDSFIFIEELMQEFGLKNPIVFIDEVQRLKNPGLLIKTIIDVKLPIKLIVSGSSQLEIKSKIQEFLTGRQLESIILPFSYQEIGEIEEGALSVYGCYPDVIKSKEKEILLDQLYKNYINRDIIEILKIKQSDEMERLITLIAHSSGQLINYNQLAIDCKISTHLVNNYLDILEKTYVIAKITPFVGNKRKEITSNPKYYFIDNGFRNCALQNFSELSWRADNGLLIESAVFQDIVKHKTQKFLIFNIHFWRTTSGAEVDFILYKNQENFIPIEVKYRQMEKPVVTRAFRSFIEAYKPKFGIFITKNLLQKVNIHGCEVHFIPFEYLTRIYPVIEKGLSLSR